MTATQHTNNERETMIATDARPQVPKFDKTHTAAGPLPTITVAELVDIVAQSYGTTADEIVGDSKKPAPTSHRRVVMWLARQLGHTHTAIGEAINRHHASVLNGAVMIENQRATNNDLRHQTDTLLDHVRELTGQQA